MNFWGGVSSGFMLASYVLTAAMLHGIMFIIGEPRWKRIAISVFWLPVLLGFLCYAWFDTTQHIIKKYVHTTHKKDTS
jgi:hypothetical protein